MAPIKFEKNIKDKLDKRRLQPSDNAWGKLSERLGNQEKKKNNKPILWLGLAASMVGILLIIPQFFNNETSVNDVPKTVVNPEIVEQNENKAIAVEEYINIENTTKETQVKEKEVVKEPAKKSVLVKSEFNKEQTALVQESNIKELNKEAVSTVEVALEPLSFEEEKIQAVANQIQALKDNDIVTDDAINALLLEAQKEIKLNRLYNGTTGVVDAKLLLQDVEAELDQSFRSKVFEAIKASYGTVKTAVAQRND
ncbi:hypothetical protein [Flavivirga spongiicola]|uniref:Anti-sigma factor n=1 Tax=Flavivirga spongiicola TaxID=421621 RepID=A0ABU7XV27_9FLAO|nr:hypothetical protein [Flavivirga sp. MEBiC05379]MDO5979643.1 hypothetical protein [Flavivirga sp. MEBiC05379]